MTRLTENWFLEPIFDLEYKSYQVLGYAKAVSDQFHQWRLYPYMEELQMHIQNLAGFQQAKSQFKEDLPKKIYKLDIQNKKIERTQDEVDTPVITNIDQIVTYAQGHFQAASSTAQKALEEVRTKIEITPIGLLEANKNSGILLIRKPKSTRIYKYDFRMVRRVGDRNTYKDLKTAFLDERSTGRFTNFSDLKWAMIRAGGALTGTNAYLIEPECELPYFETLLPLVKRMLLKQATG